MTSSKIVVMTIGSGKRVIQTGTCSTHGCVLDADHYLFPVFHRFTQLVEAVSYCKHESARWLAAELCNHDQAIRKQLAELEGGGISAVGHSYQPVNPRPTGEEDHPFYKIAPLWVEFSYQRSFVFEEVRWTPGLDDVDLMGAKGQLQ